MSRGHLTSLRGPSPEPSDDKCASAWEPAVPTDDDLAESITKLRDGAHRMIERGRGNPADYGPINVWPHTILALLEERERAIEMLDHYTVSPEDAEAMRRALRGDRG